MEIRHTERAGQRKLELDKSSKDALADYCRRRWPYHTAKSAAREWGLSVDEARGVVAARASQTTIDKIYKTGGLWLAILILQDVTGEKLADLHREVGAIHEENSESVREVLRDLLPGRAVRAVGGSRADHRRIRHDDGQERRVAQR